MPPDLKITWRVAAVWSCDDGYNNSKSRRFVLYTDCFSADDVAFLIFRLREDLDITAHLHFRKGKPLISMYGENRVRFINGITPFVSWRCFRHKLYCPPKISRNKSGRVGVFASDDAWFAKVKINGKWIGKWHRTFDEAVRTREEWELHH